MSIRVLAVAALLGAALHGEEVSIPLEGGNILIKSPSFGTGASLASFTVVNNTSDGWDLKLRLVVTSLCNGSESSHSIPVQVSLPMGASKQCDGSFHSECVWHPNKLNGVSGCALERLEGSLVSAENMNWRIDGTTGVRTDLEKQRKIEAEAQAKKEAAEALRQKRIAAEQKRKDAERDSRDAEERRKLRENCATIYQNTIDKKVKDLTVREEEQVRACQVLGLYPPR